MKRDTIEGNELIHNFLGHEKFPESEYYHGMLLPKDLIYHSSWEWLMEAVKKIWKISEEIDGKYEKEDEYHNQFYALTFHKLYIWTDKETIWNAVIEFIEWYNKWDHKTEPSTQIQDMECKIDGKNIAETLDKTKSMELRILDLFKKHSTSYCISAIQNIFGHRVEDYRWKVLVKDIMEIKSEPVPVQDQLAQKAEDERFNSVVFFIEADSYAQQSLWEQYNKETNWKQDTKGYFQQLGMIDNDENKPVCVSFSFAEIFGKRICFYECCSRYMDANIIETWIKKYYPVKWNNNQYAMTDATNFHHAMHACQK